MVTIKRGGNRESGDTNDADTDGGNVKMVFVSADLWLQDLVAHVYVPKLNHCTRAFTCVTRAAVGSKMNVHKRRIMFSGWSSAADQ